MDHEWSLNASTILDDEEIMQKAELDAKLYLILP